jgi:DNA invertase Pin-like site-specific DNA recombinase
MISAASVQDCTQEAEMNKLTFLYCRLSRDDGDSDRESNSIGNQKKILTDYAERNGFTPYAIAVDDGYTGTNYNRPGWQNLMSKVENDEVGTILVKNLDRMGRNYLQTGLYREMFQERGIRLIAVNDGIDTASGEGEDFLPFREIMAEWYARDCSRKVKAVFRSKGMAGKHIASHVPYGYKKADDDKGKWVVDEPAASVVRRIFDLTIEGFGPSVIARKLSEDKVERPSYYFAQRGIGNHQKTDFDDPYRWHNTTVTDIIARIEYTGITVNFKTTQQSFKNKHRYNNPEENLAVFENTQEPIVSEEIWELANRLRNAAKRHVSRLGEPRPLTGLLVCGECGGKMYHDRSAPNVKKPKDYYNCANHRKNASCTSHRVNANQLEELILSTLRDVSACIDQSEEDFRKMVSDMYAAKIDGSVKSRKKRLTVCEKRTAELDKLIKNLFEQQTLGNLAEKRFAQLSTEYENEQENLEREISGLRIEIDSVNDSEERANKFLELTRRYRDFTELTPAMLNEFVERVIVHERAEKKVMYTAQKVEIIFNFIGTLTIPKELSAEEIAAEKKRREQFLKGREYHREHYRKCKEAGVKRLGDLDTRTPEQKASDDASEKARQREHLREYQREYHRKHAAEKCEYEREYRKRKKEEKLAAEAAPQTVTSAA